MLAKEEIVLHGGRNVDPVELGRLFRSGKVGNRRIASRKAAGKPQKRPDQPDFRLIRAGGAGSAEAAGPGWNIPVLANPGGQV
jgi:hypothetical protein